LIETLRGGFDAFSNERQEKKSVRCGGAWLLSTFGFDGNPRFDVARTSCPRHIKPGIAVVLTISVALSMLAPFFSRLLATSDYQQPKEHPRS
jgi:hypothetical protein